jgi:hypothetical protein
MDAKCLTAEQREQLRRQVERRRDYLALLVARMDALGFPEGDPVRVAAVGARDAVGALLKALAAAEPPAPFLAHYGPGERVPYVPGPSASAPWVGKRKARRRR